MTTYTLPINVFKIAESFSIHFNCNYTTLFSENSIIRPTFKIYNTMLVNEHINKPFELYSIR